VRLIRATKPNFAELDRVDCAAADGLMIMRWALTAADLDRFPRLRCVVRMGVGYDKLDRSALAERNILVCNVPDYGTTEVADHAMALALTLRRGILLHHELQRRDPPAPWRSFHHPMIRRLGMQTFGIIGLGRIGTAVALRANLEWRNRPGLLSGCGSAPKCERGPAMNRFAGARSVSNPVC
jgi:C-terminal binding protein